MKKKLPLILGITIPTCLVVLFGVGLVIWYNKNSNNTTQDAPTETSTIETVPTETTQNESVNESSMTKDKNINAPKEKEQKNFMRNNQNKNNYSANDFDLKNFGSKEYNNSQLGIKYYAPEGCYIISPQYVSNSIDSVSSLWRSFLNNAKMEFICASEDGEQVLGMVTGELKSQDLPLDDVADANSDRKICGRNFVDVSNSGVNVYCSQIGNNVVIISTTSDSLLSGFVS